MLVQNQYTVESILFVGANVHGLSDSVGSLGRNFQGLLVCCLTMQDSSSPCYNAFKDVHSWVRAPNKH